MRYLCVDLGDKRTGLALGDTVTRLATPMRVLEVPIDRGGGDGTPGGGGGGGGALLAAIVKAVDETGPNAVVFGLPLNMDGTEGPRSKLVRAWGEKLRAAIGGKVPIEFHDERLSTARADWTMAQSGLTHGQKKARRDGIAAAAILQDFLDQLGRDAVS